MMDGMEGATYAPNCETVRPETAVEIEETLATLERMHNRLKTLIEREYPEFKNIRVYLDNNEIQVHADPKVRKASLGGSLTLKVKK